MYASGNIRCNRCKTDLRARCDHPGPDDLVFCPDCGLEVPLREVREEIGAYMLEHQARSAGETLFTGLRHSMGLKASPDGRVLSDRGRIHRFAINMAPERPRTQAVILPFTPRRS